MSSDENLIYLKPEDRIYEVATNRDEIDWKGFLQNLIHSEGLDPWDIDLAVFTKKYLKALNEIKEVDFNISGKFLTIAVFLLKVKAENLIDVEIRGLDAKIESIKNIDNLDEFTEGLDGLEDLDDNLSQIQKEKLYIIKLRNPLARKRKVNIFDLIKSLEKTFQQSNKRKINFFLKNSNVEYTGPVYDKKPKDLKVIIEDLYELIMGEFSSKSGHVCFHHLTKDINHKEGILEKFIPLLHLHNQVRVEVKQENHLGEIQIHKVNKD